MTQAQYENHRKRLDDERKAALELIEASYQTQLRALELVKLGSLQEPLSGSAILSPAAPAAVLPAPEEPRVRMGQLHADVVRVYWSLPEVFDRNDVCRALGYDPPRNSLFRVLNELVDGGTLRVVRIGLGRVATRYLRTSPSNGVSSTPDS